MAVWTDDFEADPSWDPGTDPTPWDTYDTTGGASFSLAAGSKHSGTYGARVTATHVGALSRARLYHLATVSEIFFRFWFRAVTLTVADTVYKQVANCGSTGDSWKVEYGETSGEKKFQMLYKDDDNAWHGSPLALVTTLNTWYCVEGRAKPATALGANDGKVDFWVAGINYLHVADADNDTRSITRYRQVVVAGAAEAVTYDVDDISIDTSRIYPPTYGCTVDGTSKPLTVSGSNATCTAYAQRMRRLKTITWTGQATLTLQLSNDGGSSWRSLAMTANSYTAPTSIIVHGSTQWRVALTETLSLGVITITTAAVRRDPARMRL